MWEHLSQEESARRERILSDVSDLRALHAVAFASGDVQSAAEYLGQFLGRDLVELEDPRTGPDSLLARFEDVRGDPFSTGWFQMATNVALPPALADELVYLASPSTPLDYFSDEVCAEVAGNPSLPEALVPPLSLLDAAAFYRGDDDYESDKVPWALYRNFGLSMESLETACAGHKHLAAENIAIPVEWMMDVSAEGGSSQRVSLARNMMLPAELFENLAASGDDEVLMNLATNPGAPEGFLANLSAHEDVDIRRAMALNPGIKAECLIRLSVDTDDVVAARVASHANTPLEVRRSLAQRDSAVIRNHVARCTVTPTDILGALVHDSSALVRGFVAGNPSTAPDDLLLLAHDPDERVRRLAYQNPAASDAVRAAAAMLAVNGLEEPVARGLSWQR